MTEGATKRVSWMSYPSQIVEPVPWLAILATITTILLLASLHVLSPEFSPSWRVISEYAVGRYLGAGADLSRGVGSWALAVAIWPQVQTKTGRVGLWFLIVAGLGEATASAFDITHPIGHGIAGLLGVVGFPIAALLLSVALGRNETWRTARTALYWIANLSWISVVLLVATLAIMTVQMARITRGHLPQHAPKWLPPGVPALDGWADRLIVFSNCTWVLLGCLACDSGGPQAFGWGRACLNRFRARNGSQLSVAEKHDLQTKVKQTHTCPYRKFDCGSRKCHRWLGA